MILDLVSELEVMAVLQRGEPNQECIAIRAHQDAELGRFGLMVGISGGASQGAWPLRDNLLWFGDGAINKDDWLFVYTGSGDARGTPGTSGAEMLYSIYWGRSTTIFHAPQLVPILFRIDTATVSGPAAHAGAGGQRAIER